MRIDEILETVKAYYPQADVDLIKKAYVFSAKMHAGQTRKSGEPYFVHPFGVAKILAEMHLDEASICTGLLHDTVEDTLTSIEDIERLFGKDIAYLVDGVTKLALLTFQSSEEKLAENFRKMLVAMSRDIRVLLVKLADRLHNMRTLEHMSREKQERIAAETLEIYAPLANRLGIGWMKTELEDLSFKYLKPVEFAELQEKIGKTEKERGRFIEEVSTELEKTLRSAGMQNFDVSGRPKHLWSIYRKMVDKTLVFEDIHDLIAFRVLVETIGQCYEALGHIHAMWRPIPGRFKDYIAMPKPNGYRSLHTALIGPKGERVEVQIRTYDMHAVAEGGIAAHWKYKEKGSPVTADSVADKGFLWLRQLMNWQRDLKDPSEFIDSVKVDLFAEEVYVFTPRGDVIELPRGATPVDFAFAIHSGIGMHIAGAKVNNRIVPLKYQLESGDTCEVIVNRNNWPKKAWLDFAKTSRAKTKIRAMLRQLERDAGIRVGEELLERELKRFGYSIQKCQKAGLFEKFYSTNGRFETLDDLLVALGYGKAEPKPIVEALLPDELRQAPAEEPRRSRLGQLIDRLASKRSGGVTIEGIEDILVHFARCCTPIKGDVIIGFVTRGRGLTIHRRNCPKVLELDADRRVSVRWDERISNVRPISIRVVTDDREGMLTELANAFTKLGINISEATCRTTGDGQAINTFKCGVLDLEQLKKVVRALESVKGVHSVERARSLSRE
jgi:GTP pyrophosphokinase